APPSRSAASPSCSPLAAAAASSIPTCRSSRRRRARPRRSRSSGSCRRTRTASARRRSPERRPRRAAVLLTDVQTARSPRMAGFVDSSCRASTSVDAVDPVEVADLRRSRCKVRGEVGDLLVVEVARLVGHQRMVAITAAVSLQRMRQVVTVLAADLGIGRVQRRVAICAMAVDAGLPRGLALDVGARLAFGDAAHGERVDRGGLHQARLCRCAPAGNEEEAGAQCDGKAECGSLHGAAHCVRPERKAAMSAMSWSEKLCAWTSMVGCLRVPLRYSVSALTRYSLDWPPILGTW